MGMAQLMFRRALAATALALAACATTTSSERDAPPPEGIKVYFPIAAGNSWAYEVVSDMGGGKKRTILSTAQITRADATSFDLKSGDDVSAYEIREDGFFKSKSGYYTLKDPVLAGSRWQIMDGRGDVLIRDVGVSVTLPPGTFEGCIVVVEEIFGDQRVEWTYAPNIGPVQMRVFLLEGGTPSLLLEGKLKAYQLAGTKNER